MVAIVRWEGKPRESAVVAVCDGEHIYERAAFGVILRYGRDGVAELNSRKTPPEIYDWLHGWITVREIPERKIGTA